MNLCSYPINQSCDLSTMQINLVQPVLDAWLIGIPIKVAGEHISQRINISCNLHTNSNQPCMLTLDVH